MPEKSFFYLGNVASGKWVFVGPAPICPPDHTLSVFRYGEKSYLVPHDRLKCGDVVVAGCSVCDQAKEIRRVEPVDATSQRRVTLVDDVSARDKEFLIRRACRKGKAACVLTFE